MHDAGLSLALVKALASITKVVKAWERLKFFQVSNLHENFSKYLKISDFSFQVLTRETEDYYKLRCVNDKVLVATGGPQLLYRAFLYQEVVLWGVVGRPHLASSSIFSYPFQEAVDIASAS